MEGRREIGQRHVVNAVVSGFKMGMVGCLLAFTYSPPTRVATGRHARHKPRGFGEWCEAWATGVLPASSSRATCPGGGTRTWHHLACARLRITGFEIRDSIIRMYGSRVPPSRSTCPRRS